MDDASQKLTYLKRGKKVPSTDQAATLQQNFYREPTDTKGVNHSIIKVHGQRQMVNKRLVGK